MIQLNDFTSISRHHVVAIQKVDASEKGLWFITVQMVNMPAISVSFDTEGERNCKYMEVSNGKS